MKFTIFQETRKGARQYNQDRMCYSYSRDSLLMVVADGMGGHLHGEVAAQITVELMAELFQKKAKPTIQNPHQFMIDGCMKCHDAIFNYAANHSLLETPRTTVVAAIIQDGMLYWTHVGDSRLYLIRDGETIARTRDHSKVQQMVEMGRLTPEEAERHPEKNKIYNCLGSMFPPEVEIGGKTPLLDGDTVLLCTDGLWGGVNQAELEQMLSGYPVLYALPQLLDRAEMRGGVHGDNLTGVGVNWHDEDELSGNGSLSTKQLSDGEVTTRLNTLNADKALKESKEITEADIEAAINEIQNAINKYSK
ncbi:PP2C family protein-serine/threonine phosphatase [Chitinimonas taiwanensis]|jgi:serine/threonine protein phosphatase PrpC|uniref:Serine/threonine protein phosphatase PrpC n=1 Tax=Chitinimonas taiwanensis DSM 18899 TaxID=1121279 RepID=A0A1K2HKD1_9NEIS|nr:protein phosphatase 2C domain-containing protein [Chitinimonas taiwanensis]SFZ77280.1 Serine/threonine protein phosphatase PrpC [Chitinimonas taiwanensis DSM 18899]